MQLLTPGIGKWCLFPLLPGLLWRPLRVSKSASGAITARGGKVEGVVGSFKTFYGRGQLSFFPPSSEQFE